MLKRNKEANWNKDEGESSTKGVLDYDKMNKYTNHVMLYPLEYSGMHEMSWI
jgi:hypothetical protein